MTTLSSDDLTRIEAAVTAAEAKTSGEIVCVIAGEVSDYREIPIAWAAGIAMLVPPLSFAFGLHPVIAQASPAAWTAAHAGALDGQLSFAIAVYAILQTVIFIGLHWLFAIPRLRRMLTPGGVKAARVDRAAKAHFAAVGASGTPAETGVLIFVALVDHQVEILADTAIHEKAGQSAWDRATEALEAGMKRGDGAGGIIAAVEIVGAALAEHFPQHGEADPNLLANRPVVI